MVDGEPRVTAAGSHAKGNGASAHLEVVPHAVAGGGDQAVVPPRQEIRRRREPDGGPADALGHRAVEGDVAAADLLRENRDIAVRGRENDAPALERARRSVLEARAVAMPADETAV